MSCFRLAGCVRIGDSLPVKTVSFASRSLGRLLFVRFWSSRASLSCSFFGSRESTEQLIAGFPLETPNRFQYGTRCGKKTYGGSHLDRLGPFELRFLLGGSNTLLKGLGSACFLNADRQSDQPMFGFHRCLETTSLGWLFSRFACPMQFFPNARFSVLVLQHVSHGPRSRPRSIQWHQIAKWFAVLEDV